MGTRHRKSRKRRGSRTCGWGQIGQHRKSGSRGGHGHAGMHKHKWTWVLKYDPDYFGKHGFYRPNRREVKSMNLIQLSTLVENLERRGELKIDRRRGGEKEHHILRSEHSDILHCLFGRVEPIIWQARCCGDVTRRHDAPLRRQQAKLSYVVCLMLIRYKLPDKQAVPGQPGAGLPEKLILGKNIIMSPSTIQNP